MRKIKFISIVTLIFIFAVFLCACNTKQTEKGSGGKEQNGSKTEGKAEEDAELDVDEMTDESEEVDENKEVPSDSYSELFEEDKSADKTPGKNNSENKEEKQEVTNPGSGDEMSPEQDDLAMEQVTDTETQYGAISGSNP